MPIAAVVQMEAAVVRPRTVKPSLKMTPAPRKPIPVMMPCAIRVGSVRMASSGTTDERVRPESGRSSVEGAFESDHGAYGNRAEHPDKDDSLL